MTKVASTLLKLNLVIYSAILSSRYLLKKNILLTAVLDLGYTIKNSTYFNNIVKSMLFSENYLKNR